MRKWLGRGGFALLMVVLVAFVALATWEPFFAPTSRGPDRLGPLKAEITRDEFGVPHIYGARDIDVAYGIAQAQSEDDFATLQEVVAMAVGRYGAMKGEDGAGVDYVYHLIGARETAERGWPKLPEDTRRLFDAYATGLNDYAAAHPEEVRLARLFPVSGIDVAAGFALRQPFFFGLDSFIKPLVAGEPLPREQGPAIPQETLDLNRTAPATRASSAPKVANHNPLGTGQELAGSNAFAIAPKRDPEGVTRLVSNAHQPWRGAATWYELVVESGEGWHMAGANLPGTPYPVIGHNENLGWTATVNGPDLTDVYKLVLSDDGTRYRFGDKWLPLHKRMVTLPVRVGPVVLPVRKAVYRSVHGPVLINKNGAFALRYANMDNVRATDAFYRLGKAQTLDQWQAVLARSDIPNFNLIYADKAGNIAYFYNASLPDRRPGYNWRGVLPGDDPRAVWKGPVAFDARPRYINPASGWVFNANNTPFTAAGAGDDLKQADFAPEMGVELRETNRGWRSWTLLSESTEIDRARLEEIKYDVAYERRGFIKALWDRLTKLRLAPGSDEARARDLLLAWDFKQDNIGRGDALALLMIRDAMSADYNRRTAPDTREALFEAVAHLKSHFGRIDPPMSALLRLRQGPGPYAVDLPLDGGSDTLRASTTWDVDPVDGRLAVKHGDSFVMFAEWAPGKRVVSQSIQPFGAAVTRPQSPHFTDQATLFIQHRLKPVHFWREDIRANAATRRTVAHRP